MFENIVDYMLLLVLPLAIFILSVPILFFLPISLVIPLPFIQRCVDFFLLGLQQFCFINFYIDASYYPIESKIVALVFFSST